jgi:hypothetical protein
MARPKVTTYAMLSPKRHFELLPEIWRQREAWMVAALPPESGLAGAGRGGVGGGAARGAEGGERRRGAGTGGR